MSETGVVKGFKVFDADWTCRGKQYTCPGIVEGGDKCATNRLEIVREVPWAELLELANTGKGCTGLWNSGDDNSGDDNIGNGNSGDDNSGNGNSGDGNSGDDNSGDDNIGNWNSGDDNSGNGNSGNRNSGDGNSGNRNSGDGNSGNNNSGYWNSGNWNSGDGNSGDRNSGYWNSGNDNIGNWNSGDDNSGNWNSGDRNSGDWNSGDWNKTDFSSGCFNTVEPKIYLFNKTSEWTYRDWLKSDARCILKGCPAGVLGYVRFEDMSDEEKAAHPEAKVTGGYLKQMYTSERASIWWRKLSKQEKSTVMEIPNFDRKIFKEITGVDVDMEVEDNA